GAVHVFEPAKALDVSRPGFGYDGREQVEVAEVRRAEIRKHRLGVKLGMEGRVIPAVKIVRVVPLRTVVREGLARDLTSRDAAPVSENGEHERVNARALLQDIQHALDPFI